MIGFPIIQLIDDFIQKCKKEHSVHYWIWEITTGVLLGIAIGFSLMLRLWLWEYVVSILVVRLAWMIPIGIYEKKHGYKWNWLYNK
jgi:uncharacterized membrane protein (Fun14 family)